MGRAGDRWRVVLAGATVALVGLVPAVGAQVVDPSTTTTEPSSTTSTPGRTGAEVTPVPADAGARGAPVTAAVEPLADLGYQEDEVFLAGRALIHGPRGAWGSDGRWNVSVIGESEYRTRLLVRRPVDPAAFGGTVYVSWLNVGGGYDADPEWSRIGTEVVRSGAAWVGVSAQAYGIDGPLGAKAWDPERYGTLDLDGDGTSYDVFTQAARAIRSPGEVDPLGGLPGERRLIAVGQSQSAQRLVTYLNAFQRTTGAFDGFLLVSRFRGAAPLGRVIVPSAQATDPDGPRSRPYFPDPIAAMLSGPTVAKVRDDLDVPVLVVLTETEARQDRAITPPDGEHLHTWEVAGSSHLDTTTTAALVAKLRRDFPDVPRGQLECATPNAFPTEYALRAAARALSRWVADGTAPASTPLIARDPASGALARDADGNVQGGVRLPQIAVPTARHTGESTVDGHCGLVGATKPFSQEELARRYPTPQAYVDALTAAVDASVKAGHLTPEDADLLLGVTRVPGSTATAADIVSGETGSASPPAAGGGSGASGSGSAGAGADTPEVALEAQSASRSWMATTGRDLFAPLLGGMLLLLNGRVVVTIVQQRRRPGGSSGG